ncbi:MAG: hypothetical protein M5U34_05005 [Chloroflexi bacterium]|nr:hypothetical protein [Chloroflexota bacterium]
MPQENILNTQFTIKINGTALSDAEANYIIEATVDQHTHLPHMFTIRLYDPRMELLDSQKFNLTKTVEISAKTNDGSQVVLIKGEITALEPEFQMAEPPFSLFAVMINLTVCSARAKAKHT